MQLDKTKAGRKGYTDRVWFGLLFVSVLTVLAVFGSLLKSDTADATVITKKHSQGSRAAAPLKTIKFAIVSPQIQPAILNHWIGKYLGYYRAEGIDPVIQGSAGASTTLQNVLTGQLDLGITTLETMFAAANQGIDLPVYMYDQYQLVSAYAFAVNKNSAAQTVADLKKLDKPIRIGIVSQAETGYFYGRALMAKVGIDPVKDVQWVSLGSGPAALDALKSGSVDAFSTFTSLYAIWHTQGFDARQLPQPDRRIFGIGNAFLVAKRTAVQDPASRKYLVGWARAVHKATIFAIANPNAACRIHFAMYPETLSPSISYSQNVANCLYIWRDRMGQYDIRKIKRKTWGGPISGDQLALYTGILGYGTSLNTDSMYTNFLIKAINKGINEAQIVKQAKNYCKQKANVALCTKK